MVICKEDKTNNKIIVRDVTSFDEPYDLFSIDYLTKEDKDAGKIGICYDDAKIITSYLSTCYNRFLGEDTTQIY